MGKPDETCLIKMVIACENMGHVEMSHDQKTARIYQRPIFVKILLKKRPCFFVEGSINVYYLYRWMGFDGVNGSNNLLTWKMIVTCEKWNEFRNNVVGCDEVPSMSYCLSHKRNGCLKASISAIQVKSPSRGIDEQIITGRHGFLYTSLRDIRHVSQPDQGHQWRRYLRAGKVGR